MATKLSAAAQVLLQSPTQATEKISTAVTAVDLIQKDAAGTSQTAEFDTYSGNSNPEAGAFMSGMQAGTRQVEGDFQTFAAGIDLIQAGEDETSKDYKPQMAAAEINIQQAARQEELANEIRDNFVKFPEAFDSFGNFKEFALFQTGQVVPQIATMLGGGVYSAAMLGLGKVILKTGGKKWVKQKTKDIVDKKAANIALTRADKTILADAQSGIKYALGTLDNKVINSKNAFWLGGFGSSYVMNSAQSLNEYGDQGFTLTNKEAKLAAA